MPTVFGYKADGDARLFELAEGALLPSGWSDDIAVIEDPAKRSGDAISMAAGGAGATPILVAAADRAEVVPPLPAVNYDHAGHMREVWAKRKARAPNKEKANDAI